MKKIGIIAEYNPFHFGHRYQLEKIREKYQNPLIIVVISGNVVQRGEFSIIDKFQKTALALKYGADIVIQLPVSYSLSGAKEFAFGAVKALSDFGVEEIVFGSENKKLSTLKKIAKFINLEENQEKIKKSISIKHSFKSVFYNFLLTNYNEKIKPLKSNELLGICYLQAGEKINPNLTFSIIKRNQKFRSASSIRKSLSLDDQETKKLFLEEFNLQNLIFMDQFLFAITSKILLSNVDDPLIHYLKKILSVNNFKNWETFLKMSENKTFSRAIIARKVLAFFLEIVDDQDLPLRLLGLSQNGKRYLRENRDMKLKYSDKFKKEYLNDFKIAVIIKNFYPDFWELEKDQTTIIVDDLNK